MKSYLASLCRQVAVFILSTALFVTAARHASAQILSPTTATAKMGPIAPAARAAAVPMVASNYVLKPNDEIQVRVFRNADLDGMRRISKDGTIDFPLLGIVKLSGKTTYEAAAHLAALLDKDYLVRPQVFVNVSVASRRYFDIMGEVASPGTKEYPDDRDLDLLGAISLAGGWTKTASQVNIIVKRQVQGQDQLIKVDAARMTKEKGMPSFVILPNDIIVVKERLL
ncbi:MAG TPA: polysaccharide biosynthesis/export family protein [Chthoniobacter sp.]|nr:polysaccharide biosynthesis/export family protein [Chthoniobacter sp.]